MIGIKQQLCKNFLIARRFYKELPDIHVQPLINIDNRFILHCSLDGASSRGVQLNGTNIIKLRSLDKLDAFRYIISTQHEDNPRPASSPRHSPGYVLTAEERKRPIETIRGVVETIRGNVTAFAETLILTGDIKFRVVRAVFIALDVLLLVYRVSRTYVRCCKFYRKSRHHQGDDVIRQRLTPRLVNGSVHVHRKMSSFETVGRHCSTPVTFDSPPVVMTERLVRKDDDHDCCHRLGVATPKDGAEYTSLHELTDLASSAAGFTTDGGPSGHPPPLISTVPSGSQNAAKTGRPRASKSAIAVRCLRSNALPRVLLGLLTLISVLVGVNVALLLLNVKTLADLDSFSLFLNVLRLHTQETQSFAVEDADRLNDVLLRMCQRHMTTELVHLQSVIDYFKAGKHILFHLEGSSIKQCCTQNAN